MLNYVRVLPSSEAIIASTGGEDLLQDIRPSTSKTLSCGIMPSRIYGGSLRIGKRPGSGVSSIMLSDWGCLLGHSKGRSRSVLSTEEPNFEYRPQEFAAAIKSLEERDRVILGEPFFDE